MTDPNTSLSAAKNQLNLNPEEISIESYTYELPDKRIAKYPLPKRDRSKLLVFKQGQIEQCQYRHLDKQLPAGSLLVFNDTKVVEARLNFKKPSGSKIEIFCLEPGGDYPDMTTAMMQTGSVLWKCLVGGAKKWKSGTLHLSIYRVGKNTLEIIELFAEMVEKLSDAFLIRFYWQPDEKTFAEILHRAGDIPLPPYLNREVKHKDSKTYQTVYASHAGSVAAPTAGLHFTPKLLKKLSANGISEAFLTLHVGAGTFKPVKSDKMKDHEMHAEFIEVPIPFLEQLHRQALSKEKIIAVGTTSLRTLESLYWMGVKLLTRPEDEAPYVIKQWEPYRLVQDITLPASLEALISAQKAAGNSMLLTYTQIIIAPGYKLRVADGILTNFHQPKSTLLLLIAAIVGDKWKEIYQYALDNDFRFLSYGDGSLLWK